MNFAERTILFVSSPKALAMNTFKSASQGTCHAIHVLIYALHGKGVPQTLGGIGSSSVESLLCVVF